MSGSGIRVQIVRSRGAGEGPVERLRALQRDNSLRRDERPVPSLVCAEV